MEFLPVVLLLLAVGLARGKPIDNPFIESFNGRRRRSGVSRKRAVVQGRRNSRHLQRIIAKAEVLYDSADGQFARMR